MYVANYTKKFLKSLQFEIHLVDHCNLNCQMCDHFSPLAKKNYLSLSSFNKDCSRLSELFNKTAQYVRLLGGEPLLHPNVSDFFLIARKWFPFSQIQLFTNGLLLKKQNEIFWNATKTNNISIHVTKYPINYPYSELENFVISKGVEFQYVNKDTVKTSWKLPLNLNGDLNSSENYMVCNMGNECIFLKDGNLYPCTVPPNIEHFNRYFNKSIELSPLDGINIYSAKNSQEILDFLRKPIPFCRYCNVRDRSYNHTWKLSQKNISEWC